MPAFLRKKVYSNDLQHREPAKYRPILRSSQVTYAARLLRRMEGQGHGFSEAAQQRLTAFKDGFRDISNVPPKSKMIGLLQRLSSALRMFTSSQKN